jgi:hypothetical protein
MTYLMYSGNNLRNWLKYYAPLALANNRMYYTLLTMAIVASTARSAWAASDSVVDLSLPVCEFADYSMQTCQVTGT